MKKVRLSILMLLTLCCFGDFSVINAEAAAIDIVKEQFNEEIFKVAEIHQYREGEEYRLSKYDVINIMILGFPDGIGVDDIQIDVDGMVRLPYAGNIKLTGLTLDEAKDILTEKLGKYIKIPELNIYLKSYGARKIYVMGSVNVPGEKNMNVDNLNVYAAIANAGGVDKRGRSKHVQVLRQIGNTLYYREVNLDAYVKQHDLSQNIALQDGDIVYVPDSGKVIFSEDVLPYINVLATYKALTK